MKIWILDHTKQIIYNAEIKSSKNILIRYYFTINSIKRYQVMQYGEKRYNIPSQKSLTSSTVQHLNLIVIRNSKCISSSTFSDLVLGDIFFNFCYCRTSALTESVQALMKSVNFNSKPSIFSCNYSSIFHRTYCEPFLGTIIARNLLPWVLKKIFLIKMV